MAWFRGGVVVRFTAVLWQKNYKKRLFGLPEVSLYHIAEEARAVLGVFGGIEDIDTDYCSR